MTDNEIQELVTGLIGRMAMLETLNANMLARLVAQFENPVPLAVSIMDATLDQLSRIDPGRNDAQRRVQLSALQSFDGLSKSMLAMVNRIAEPQGRG